MSARPDPLAVLERHFAPEVLAALETHLCRDQQETALLLSVAHVAERLDCSVTTVRRRIATGALPAVVDHGRLMVRGDDLRAYVDGLQGGAPRAAGRRSRARAARGRFDFLRDP